METTTFWVLQISLRDCLKAQFIINDFHFRGQKMEWVATDTATIWCEDLADEITHRLDAQGVEFELKQL
jgi:hypothetical protein